MNARDEYPIAQSALAWHSQWSEMCNEINRLRAENELLRAELAAHCGLC